MSLVPSFGVAFTWPVYKPSYDLLLNDQAWQNSLNPDSIRVLNWNIYKGSHENLIDEFRLRSEGQDLVLSQEFFSSNELEKLRTIQGFESIVAYAYGVSFWGMTGVMTLSSAPSTESFQIRTQHRENFVVGTYKTGLVSKYPMSGSLKELLVINVHFLNSVSRDKYLDELLRYKDVIQFHDGPVIFAGDFNSWNDRVDLLMRFIKALNMESVNFTPDHRTRFGTSPVIDYVFYRGLKVMNSKSSKTKVSDHNPINVEFEVIDL